MGRPVQRLLPPPADEDSLSRPFNCIFDRWGDAEWLQAVDEVREADVLLDQCAAVVERIRRRAGEQGIGIRLAYLLTRQHTRPQAMARR